MIKAINCKRGSAWHTWQINGAEWATRSSETTREAIAQAAEKFANAVGYPQAAIEPRYKAFIEGVKIYKGTENESPTGIN
jgi:hypothetical protein